MMTDSTTDPFWSQYSLTYRAGEMATLARWIAAGESGAVVGLVGTGRATLLGFLCHRPDALQSYLPPHSKPAVLVPVDLNNLPDKNRLATLYRVILRSLYEIRGRFDPAIAQTIHDLYRRHEAARDPFLPQSALRELLLLCQAEGQRVFLVMNRFDTFCRSATPAMTNTLRGLRDSFKDTLAYIMGMRQEVAYLTDLSSIGPVYAILDTNVCWVGPLAEADARAMIAGEMHDGPRPLTRQEIEHLLALTGGFPSLIRVACHWAARNVAAGSQAATNWPAALLAQRNTQHRLSELWNCLTLEEQLLLIELQKGAGRPAGERASFGEPQQQLLDRLVVKGVCRRPGSQWRIVSDLLAAYAASAAGQSRGKLWLDATSGDIYQGQARVDGLQPQERAVLAFLLGQPYSRHTHTDIIEATWPDEVVVKEGVTTEALYQVMRGIRKKIEPNPARPRYVITWRGQPEGGYQFFPEGRPEE